VFCLVRQPPVAAGDATALIRGIRDAVRRALAEAGGCGTLQAVVLSVANPVRPDGLPGADHRRRAWRGRAAAGALELALDHGRKLMLGPQTA
jgi:hypothetical protein